MSRQELYLFIHIAAAVLWVGGGTVIGIMGGRAIAANDRDHVRVVVQQAAFIGQKIFLPLSVIVLIMGILLVADGPWEMDLWVVLGLIGFFATAVTGATILGPRSEKIAGMIDASGGQFNDDAYTESRKLLTLARIDSVVLFLVIALMALKPTGDDVGVLVVMALILVGGIAWSVSRYKAIDAEGTPTGIVTA